MLNKIIKYSYLLLVAFACYQGYERWNEGKEVLAGLEAEKENIINALEVKKKRLKDLDDYFSRVEERQAGIDLILKSIDKFQRLLPNVNDDLKNKQILKEMAKKVNLREVKILSKDPVEKEFYFLSTYELIAQGTYLQFLLFLEEVSNSKRLLNISFVQFQMPKIKQKGRYIVIDGKIIIESFRYNSKNDEGASVQDISKRFEVLKDQRRSKIEKNKKKNEQDNDPEEDKSTEEDTD